MKIVIRFVYILLILWDEHQIEEFVTQVDVVLMQGIVRRKKKKREKETRNNHEAIR